MKRSLAVDYPKHLYEILLTEVPGVRAEIDFEKGGDLPEAHSLLVRDLTTLPSVRRRGSHPHLAHSAMGSSRRTQTFGIILGWGGAVVYFLALRPY